MWRGKSKIPPRYAFNLTFALQLLQSLFHHHEILSQFALEPCRNGPNLISRQPVKRHGLRSGILAILATYFPNQREFRGLFLVHANSFAAERRG